MKEVNTSEEILQKANESNDPQVQNKIETENKGTKMEDLNESTHTNQWCPGCGDFGILLAIKKAIVDQGLNPKDVVIVSGIGCSSKLPHYIKTFGIETIHGRALPVATGLKFANKDLHVIVVGGDGDGYGIGMGHLIHTMRRNLNLTYIVHNNEIYGLTKGQTSPTSPKGRKTVSTPNGAIETAVNPIELSLAGGASFIARGFAGDLQELSKIIVKGMQHKGFSIIDVAQPCVSYNPEKSYQYYQENIFKIEELSTYNPKSKVWAHAVVNMDHKGKIPVGIFYQNQDLRETYIDDLPEDKDLPLVKQDVLNINVEKILDNYE